jgi:hypothetical protein
LVCADEESIQLLQELDRILQRAGWKRTKPPGGFPAINVFGGAVDVAVPVGPKTGIQISVDSSESLTVLQSLPLEKLPQYVRAGVALNLSLSSNLFPPQENSGKPVNVELGNSTIIRIAVGKKP